MYIGKDDYPLQEGEERILVKIAPERVEAQQRGVSAT